MDDTGMSNNTIIAHAVTQAEIRIDAVLRECVVILDHIGYEDKKYRTETLEREDAALRNPNTKFFRAELGRCWIDADDLEPGYLKITRPDLADQTMRDAEALRARLQAVYERDRARAQTLAEQFAKAAQRRA